MIWNDGFIGTYKVSGKPTNKVAINLTKYLASLCLLGFLGCANVPTREQSQMITFRLEVDHESAKHSQAHIEIHVPASVSTFQTSQNYGGGQSFLKFLSQLQVVDTSGRSLPFKQMENKILITGSGNPYVLRYSYNVPQQIAEQVDASLPTLDEKHGRFDGNLTFLTPIGAENLPAHLTVSVPKEWKIATGWGFERDVSVSKVSLLISAQIVFGDYEFSTERLDQIEFHFASRGLLEPAKLKQYFLKLFATQSEIMGPLPFTPFLVVFQPTVKNAAKGSALTNSLVVNIPPGEKLDPFNFAVVGTISHELFHQWDLYNVPPASEDGAYLFTEGFDNYFAVATLVRAGFISEARFARFLWKYRGYLEGNSKYPTADFAAIQAGFNTGDEALTDLAYSKGPFVAILLDMALREDTHNRVSLVSWMREWTTRFAGTKGYTIEDLRRLTMDLSGNATGKASHVFDSAFLGNRRLDLDALFKKLGIVCTNSGDCSLKDLSPSNARVRSQIFSAATLE